MCGIAGIIQASQSYGITDLKKMTDALSHRGPDGEGYWQDETGSVMLGHRRLTIIDLSKEAAQPFGYLDRYIAIHNGEIYNYIELKEELKGKGYLFKTQTDTEVLVAAYDYWKEECVQRFDGMFAFAIWDQQERRLFAARDRFGEKPFHYMLLQGGNTLLFASEIKAFWALGKGRKLNRKMLFNFLTIGYTDNPEQPSETFYEEVNKLPAASFLRIWVNRRVTLDMEKYWDIEVDNQDLKIGDHEAITKFRGLITASVTKRLRSDVPLGTSLSGGLDSSSIASIICHLDNAPIRRLHTFSTIFPGFEKNEEKYINDVQDRLPIESHKTFISDNEIPMLFSKVIKHQDEPFGNASVLPQYKTFELATNNNITVLLDGQGADETIAGYYQYYKWYWQELFRSRRLMKSKELKKAKELGVHERFRFQNIIAALFPDFASVFLERQYLLHALRHDDLSREFVHLQSKEAYYTTPPILSLNGVLYFNTCVHGLEELLRYADRNSMAHGRELRLPFLSHELVEFVFSLPAKFKIREGWTKWILRQAMEPQLPSSITWRKGKVGFEPPQFSWMQLPAMQQMIQEAKRKLVNEEILKPDVMNKKIKPAASYDKENYDWRYLVSAQFL